MPKPLLLLCLICFASLQVISSLNIQAKFKECAELTMLSDTRMYVDYYNCKEACHGGHMCYYSYELTRSGYDPESKTFNIALSEADNVVHLSASDNYYQAVTYDLGDHLHERRPLQTLVNTSIDPALLNLYGKAGSYEIMRDPLTEYEKRYGIPRVIFIALVAVLEYILID